MTAATPTVSHPAASERRRPLRWLRSRLAALVAKPRGLARSTKGLLAGLLVLFVLLAAALAYLTPRTAGEQLTLDGLADHIAAAEVASATFLDEDARVAGVLEDGDRFWVAYPKNDVTTAALIAELTDAGARVEVDTQQVKATVRLLATTLLPLMILANLFALLFVAGRSDSSGIGELMDFSRIGKDGASVAGAVTFDDVAGVEEAIVELREVVDYLADPGRYAELGAVPPKGVLLHGPPGCGKTLLARAVAGEAQVPFFSVAGAEFVESLVGVGAARMRDLFAKVRAVAPAIVFIDELDAAGRRRGSGSGGGSEEREQTLNQLLVEMDGFEVSAGIVVMAATNRPDILDPALLRPGRFDRHVTIDPPDVERREAILRLHARGRPVGAGVDFATIARQTPGFTGADLANVINEGALLTIRAGKREIDGHTLSEAVQRVLAGPQRRGHLLSDAERKRLAYHEAGHAIVATALGRTDEVHRVSIVARGRALGTAALGRRDDAVALTASELRQRLTIALSGRAAEELAFDEPSTLAEDDLDHATDLAFEIAGRYGMTARVGLASLLAPAADHLGNRGDARPLSATTHAALDAEVRQLLDEARDAATAVLEQHRADVDRLVERLLEEETLEDRELAALLPRQLSAPRAAAGRRDAGA